MNKVYHKNTEARMRHYNFMVRNHRHRTNPVTTGDKVGRNEPCPCGSGKKYKNCCLTQNQ